MAAWRALAFCMVASVRAAEEGKASAETEACSGSSLLLAVKDLAPSCIAACPDICPHLETLIMQALMNIDPLPYVCANSATFLCMDTTACDSLLDTAESYNLFHVPRSEQELQDACNPPDTSSTAAPSTSQEETEAQTDVVQAVKSVPEVAPSASTSLRTQPALTSRAPSTSQTSQADSEPPAAGVSSTGPPANDAHQSSDVSSTGASQGFQDAIALDFASPPRSLRWALAVALAVGLCW